MSAFTESSSTGPSDSADQSSSTPVLSTETQKMAEVSNLWYENVPSLNIKTSESDHNKSQSTGFDSSSSSSEDNGSSSSSGDDDSSSSDEEDHESTVKEIESSTFKKRSVNSDGMKIKVSYHKAQAEKAKAEELYRNFLLGKKSISSKKSKKHS